MRSFVPGQWYLLYTCCNCKRRQVIFADLSGGKANIDATYHVDCPQCGHHGQYDGDRIERYQHPGRDAFSYPQIA